MDVNQHKRTSGPETYVYYIASFAALNSVNLGYDIGVNSGIGYHLQEGSLGLSDTDLEAFMGLFGAFSLVGALSAHWLSDGFGRRGAFAGASLSFIIGIVWTLGSSTLGWMLVGRCIMGIGVGLGLAIDPLYIAECSPAKYRGQLVTWSETANNVGILLGFLAGLLTYTLPNDTAWRLMLGLGTVIPAVLLALVAFVMPESPRWLLLRDREAEARRVLRRCHGPGAHLDAVVAAVQDELAEAAAAAEGGDAGWCSSSSSTCQGLLCAPPPAVRRMLVAGVGTAVVQQLTGIEAIQYYLLFVLEASGIESRRDQFAFMLLIGAVKAGIIVVAGRLFDHPKVTARRLGRGVQPGPVGARAQLLLRR